MSCRHRRMLGGYCPDCADADAAELALLRELETAARANLDPPEHCHSKAYELKCSCYETRAALARLDALRPGK